LYAKSGATSRKMRTSWAACSRSRPLLSTSEEHVQLLQDRIVNVYDTVLTGPQRLRQVLIGLLGNAMKSRRECGGLRRGIAGVPPLAMFRHLEQEATRSPGETGLPSVEPIQTVLYFGSIQFTSPSANVHT
jgi:hypothetical protein